MDINEYKLVKEVQDKHWWWRGRRRIIESIIEYHVNLKKALRIADIGCGFGANIPMLRQYGEVTGFDAYREATEQIREKWGASVETYVWKFPDSVPEKFDFILLADVLEHIPFDGKAVAWIDEHLKEGGYVLLTVPAYRFLWTQMDEAVHHIRRYNRKDLLALFGENFEIVKFSFYNFFLFPVKVIFSLVVNALRKLRLNNPQRSYNDLPPQFVNFVFRYILYIESELIKKISFPFGVSIVLLVQKRKNDR